MQIEITIPGLASIAEAIQALAAAQIAQAQAYEQLYALQAQAVGAAQPQVPTAPKRNRKTAAELASDTVKAVESLAEAVAEVASTPAPVAEVAQKQVSDVFDPTSAFGQAAGAPAQAPLAEVAPVHTTTQEPEYVVFGSPEYVALKTAGQKLRNDCGADTTLPAPQAVMARYGNVYLGAPIRSMTECPAQHAQGLIAAFENAKVFMQQTA